MRLALIDSRRSKADRMIERAEWAQYHRAVEAHENDSQLYGRVRGLSLRDLPSKRVGGAGCDQ
jgi:hypothetical protein